MKARKRIIMEGVERHGSDIAVAYRYNGVPILVSASDHTLTRGKVEESGKLNIMVSVYKSELRQLKDIDYVLRAVGIDTAKPYNETDYNSGLTINRNILHYFEQLRDIQDIPEVLLNTA